MDFTKDVASISFPDLAPAYNFEALNTAMSASTSSLVGFIKMVEVRKDYTDTAKMYHYSNYNDNPCFIVHKPQSNFFRVLLKDSLGDDLTDEAKPYCLILNFKKV